MSETGAKRPLSTLQKNRNKMVTVRLKDDVEYKGRIGYVDPYMHLIMLDAEEIHGGKVMASYGRVIVRGNNILYVRLEDEL